MGGLALQLDTGRRREFRRWLAFSLLAHAALLLVFSRSPGIEMARPPGVIAIELVAAPAAAPARAAAAPRPAPPPVQRKIVLPEKPAPLPEPKPKPKPAPKPAAKPEPRPVAKPPEPVQKDYGDVLKQLRAEAGEGAPDAAQAAPARAAAPGAGGSGRPVSPEVAAWLKKAEVHVRRAWVMPAGFRMQPLVTVVEVDLGADGAVRGEPEIVRRSGNPWYDENVVRGVRKASPLPAPPAAGNWTFVFDAEEAY